MNKTIGTNTSNNISIQNTYYYYINVNKINCRSNKSAKSYFDFKSEIACLGNSYTQYL